MADDRGKSHDNHATPAKPVRKNRKRAADRTMISAWVSAAELQMLNSLTAQLHLPSMTETIRFCLIRAHMAMNNDD